MLEILRLLFVWNCGNCELLTGNSVVKCCWHLNCVTFLNKHKEVHLVAEYSHTLTQFSNDLNKFYFRQKKCEKF